MAEQTSRERRAAARRERRSATDIPGETDAAEAADLLQDDPAEALRAAASAAIAAAAVGAAHALVRRRRDVDESRDDDDATPPAAEEGGVDDEPEVVEEELQRDEPAPAGDEPEHARPASRSETRRIVDRAREQLSDLRGADAEAVSSIRRTTDGWRVGLEVVEVHRVPDSTDVMATYELELDDDGNLLTFARTERYYRSEADHR